MGSSMIVIIAIKLAGLDGPLFHVKHPLIKKPE